MKKYIPALGLALVLLLSGCASMLERNYLSVSPHEAVSGGGSSSANALRVENYQDLVNAVLYLVSEGTEHGVLGLYNYTRDVETDLAAACLEVVQEDPLGAYAVDYIKHDHALIVSYYEANIYITYRRTPEQVASIASATGSSAIRQELRQALSSFLSEAVLRVNYFAEDEAYILDLVRQAYYDTPSAALGMPGVEVALYPETGVQRIVEVALTWPEPSETLREKSLLLGKTAIELIPDQADARALYQLLTDQVQPVSEGNTAYDALVLGAADSEGIALAYQLFCAQAGLSCTVVQGENNGVPYYWNIVIQGEDAFHVDGYGGLFGLSDADLLEVGGYAWASEEYPSCTAVNFELSSEN